MNTPNISRMDFFAAHALQGLLASGHYRESADLCCVASLAFAIAKSMVEESALRMSFEPASEERKPEQDKLFRNTTWAMKRCGYASAPAFRKFVIEAGVPHIRLNARTWKFDEDALEAWLSSKSVGNNRA